ncbi:related to G/U mismatch-specific uracil DNA glycosylase [Cephalotrichum gorgonifer]|uniref:Related to G/U mismatch-specific uracil DNA glycosylase n=1 Tax=Cephalotrichum gorgonifer TaxID=2041049 RepID=A0AAE8MXF5_9PEZI|nr:related to G/U mismatch-specific uracil DNA glycosylase [Cephalotrichum gorgonifer]
MDEEKKVDGEGRKATFSGRLNIADFAFKDAAAPRRSPRLLTPDTAAPPRSPSSSSTKRKAGSELTPSTASESSPAPTPTSPSSRSSSLRKKSRKASGYAPPSTYAHLSPLTDALGPDLLVLFVGLNPGVMTARTGHAYAHPSNSFWKLLFSSGVTPRLVSPTEDKQMPHEYALGLTNIVARPSRNGSELSKEEMDCGVGELERKARECRPEVVCFVGKSIWESVWRVRKGRGIRKEEFKYGWQDEGEAFAPLEAGEEGEEAWAGAKIFVASSTSGLAATLSPAQKQAIWRELGVYVERRRAERAELAKSAQEGQGTKAEPT